MWHEVALWGHYVYVCHTCPSPIGHDFVLLILYIRLQIRVNSGQYYYYIGFSYGSTDRAPPFSDSTALGLILTSSFLLSYSTCSSEPHNYYYETVECGRRCLLTGALGMLMSLSIGCVIGHADWLLSSHTQFLSHLGCVTSVIIEPRSAVRFIVKRATSGLTR